MNLSQPFEPACAVVLLLALCMVGVTALRTSLLLYSAQSLVLGLLAIYVGHVHGETVLVGVGIAVAAGKGFAAPIYLTYAARRIGCRRDADMSVAAPLQVFLALAGVAMLFLLRPLRDEFSLSTLPAFATLLLGMMLMVTRRLAVSQILGFLVLESGMFLYTIAQPFPMPIIVEIGALMDVLALTMLTGLLAFRINRTFEHIDVTDLKELRG